VFRRIDQRFNGGAHRLVGRAQNVDPIDLDVINNANRPSDIRIGDQFLVNSFSKFGCELFRILQFAVSKPFGQDNRSGYHRTGQGASPSFINAGDPADSDCAKFFLVSKTASPVHETETTEKLKS
jgi:hypothetical protein